MGNAFDRKMSDVAIAQLESKVRKMNTNAIDMDELIEFFYPVGSYYETSNTDFDPNAEWTGTWELESEGLVHIGAGNNYTAGATGGSATHTLTVNEMPSHSHSCYIPYKSTVVISTGTEGSAAYDQYGGNIQTDTGTQGGGQPHSIMQPYIVVNRWHRTE